MQVMEYKRGTSLDFAGRVFFDEGGAPLDLTGWSVDAQVRREAGGAATALIADLGAEVIDAPAGLYRIRVTDLEAAAMWPLGWALFDIVFVAPDGRRLPTVSFIRLQIIDAATRGVM